MNEWNKNETGKILLDTNLIILSANKKAIKFLGLEKYKVEGTNLFIALDYKLRKTLSSKLQIIINQKIKQTSHKLLLNFVNHKTGNIKITLKSIPHKKQKILNPINFILSVEKNNKKNVYLSSELINNLSHELRSPLCNIQSFLETLYEYNKKLTSEQRLEFIEIAVNETNRLNKLVNDILDFSTIENKKSYQEQILKISLNSIIHQVFQLNQLQAINKKILLTRTIKVNEVEIVADHDSIMRIILNLINNSIKFSYPNGIINIKIKKIYSVLINQKSHKYTFKISVTDTGIGISKEDISMIFNRFSRVNKIENKITGSGLGLAIIKDILNMDNQVLNMSTYLGRGTKASFKINKLEKGLEPATY